ncbi:DnaA regulatory inactivator Hda [Halochromatium salexigens]|uniref:DnaA regulatory inactivator Hda n=2 Tax=Halochromatium salexigens TaxID=49447 RepID=A0AAJ0UCY7_HALSE|nr:DnaA regulatory inactivator Hda [Halochromatium salexigens]MBK5929202.1 DnaA regulatory inactivator Hda [Halochromatium salexigens]
MWPASITTSPSPRSSVSSARHSVIVLPPRPRLSGAEPPVHEPPPPQLALALRQPEPSGLDGFVSHGNASVVAAVRHWADGSGEPYLYIHGAAASGKSRLLVCAAGEIRQRGLSVIYLPLDTPKLTPDVLDDLEQRDAILLDAVQAIAGNRAWEQALFNLYNRARDARRRLLAAARQPTGRLGLQLPDLSSRLAAGPSYNLKPLSDAGRAELLRIGAEQRGLRLGDAMISYILSRCPRDPGVLRELLDTIDRSALAEQRQPSIRSIGRLLEQLERSTSDPQTNTLSAAEEQFQPNAAD